MVVMDDRVLLLEIKDWNGLLTSNGDVWLINDGPRGRSPVDLVGEKAKKLNRCDSRHGGTGLLDYQDLGSRAR